ncbi:MAG: DUF1801 domain-containing protein [Bacteroidota bacterium]
METKITYNTVDEYISTFPKEVKEILENLRKVIKETAPEAQEAISYNMPGYKQNGMLLWFAAAKNHIGLYPTASPIIFFKEALKEYKTSKGAIQFPINKPIPLNLVREIIKFKVEENTSKLKKPKKPSVIK